MILFPYKSYIIETDLDFNECKSKLTQVIEPKEFFGIANPNSSKPFRGEIKNNKFKIVRIFEGINSFVPVILGEIENGRVLIKMRLYYFVYFFILVSFVLATIIGTTMLKQYGLGFLVVINFLVLTYMYGMVIVFFTQEVKRAKAILEKVLRFCDIH